MKVFAGVPPPLPLPLTYDFDPRDHVRPAVPVPGDARVVAALLPGDAAVEEEQVVGGHDPAGDLKRWLPFVGHRFAALRDWRLEARQTDSDCLVVYIPCSD